MTDARLDPLQRALTQLVGQLASWLAKQSDGPVAFVVLAHKLGDPHIPVAGNASPALMQVFSSYRLGETRQPTPIHGDELPPPGNAWEH